MRSHMAAARQRARESRPAARRAEPLRALRRRAWLAAALCAALGPALAPGPACAGGATGARAERDATALVAFLPARGADEAASELASVPGLSLAIMSASQGTYTLRQLLVDIGQGTRIASSAYAHGLAPQLSVAVSGTGASVRGWAAIRKRAEDAPQLLAPGLLAASIPGGAGYAGISGVESLDAVLAADRRGTIAAATLGPAASLPARARGLLAHERLVVCDLSAGARGREQLRALARARAPRELLVVLQRVAHGSTGQLLWAAAAGLGPADGGELSSATTQQRGLISAIDLAPTVLAHLGLSAHPPDMRGAQIRSRGSLRLSSLRALMARMRVIGGRRLKALGLLVAAWALALLACERSPAVHRARRRAWAMRAGALALLWAPLVSLLPAALEPPAPVEYALITSACLALGALTDRLLPWPRAPVAPALATLVALVIDALARSQLLLRSLIGPNPILGARFYGFGNELKSALAVLVFVAVAAALTPARDWRPAHARARRNAPQSSHARARAAGVIAATGALLALIEGWARIGAAVGGVILVSAGAAVATIMLLPASTARTRALIALLAPPAALVALAALDLAAASGAGHFTGSILHARSAGDLRDVLVRRYNAAWLELGNHAMPAATALALLASALALARQRHLLAPVGGDPVWRAALAGGLAAGIVGALVEDSGPVLFVVAVFALGCALTYLWGTPPRRRVASAAST